MDFSKKDHKNIPQGQQSDQRSQSNLGGVDYLGFPSPPGRAHSKSRSASPAAALPSETHSLTGKQFNDISPSSDVAFSTFNSTPFQKSRLDSRESTPTTTGLDFLEAKHAMARIQSTSPSNTPAPPSRQIQESSGWGWHQISEPVPEPDSRAKSHLQSSFEKSERPEIVSPPLEELKEQSLSTVRPNFLPFNESQSTRQLAGDNFSSVPFQPNEARQAAGNESLFGSNADRTMRQSVGQLSATSTLHPQMHPQPQYEAHLATHGDAEIHIPIDTGSDRDSAYDDGADLESATTSLKSAISDYIYENGRRYHAYRAGEYWGPNDEQMADQLDIGHHVHTMVLDGRLHLAPIGDNPHRCLDVGTGTGIWAIDFADLYPGCQVIGTDLSPTQPSHVPPNLEFEVDDACSEWVYTKESFDFIHVRGMYGSVSDWPKFYAECMKHLKPGGYLEQVDTSVEPKSDDGTVPRDSAMAKWGSVSLEAGDAFGKTLRCVDENRQNFIDAGFEEVVEYRFKLPIGGWSKDKRLKEIGMYTRLYWEEGIEGWCLFLLTRYLGWKYEEVMVYVAQMRRMLRDKNVHAYHDGSVVYGKKPFRRL